MSWAAAGAAGGSDGGDGDDGGAGGGDDDGTEISVSGVSASAGSSSWRGSGEAASTPGCLDSAAGWWSSLVSPSSLGRSLLENLESEWDRLCSGDGEVVGGCLLPAF